MALLHSGLLNPLSTFLSYSEAYSITNPVAIQTDQILHRSQSDNKDCAITKKGPNVLYRLDVTQYPNIRLSKAGADQAAFLH